MDIHSVDTQQVLDQISRHCPDALWVYLQCVNRADIQGTVFFSQDLVKVDMSEDWHPFKNKVKKLAREGLLEWHPFDGGISVTLANVDE